MCVRISFIILVAIVFVTMHTYDWHALGVVLISMVIGITIMMSIIPRMIIICRWQS